MHLVYGLFALAPVAVLNCTITTTDTSSAASTSTSESSSSTSSSTSGTGGSATTSTGGTGGVGVGGFGGVGGTGVGGSGGAMCNDGTGKGQPQECGSLPSAPPKQCTGENAPPYTACVAAIPIFQAGQWEEYDACLKAIPDANACDPNATGACTTQVYTNACDNAATADACMQIQAACVMNGDMTFDVAKCTGDTKIFTLMALDKVIVTCMNDKQTMDPTKTCATAYQECFGAVFGG